MKDIAYIVYCYLAIFGTGIIVATGTAVVVDWLIFG